MEFNYYDSGRLSCSSADLRISMESNSDKSWLLRSIAKMGIQLSIDDFVRVTHPFLTLNVCQ